MSWLRLDDRFDEHPKIVELAPADAWTWLRVLLYCARNKTGGRVSVAALARLSVDESLIDFLISLHLLDLPRGREHITHYVVHDWQAYNGAASGAQRTAKWRESRITTSSAAEFGSSASSSQTLENGDADVTPSDARVTEKQHGGRRGDYGSTASSVTPGDEDVTTSERHSAVTTRASGPQPIPKNTSSRGPYVAPAAAAGIDLEQLGADLAAAGWTSSQQDAAAESPKLAAAWIARANADATVKRPGAFAWQGFTSGSPPPLRPERVDRSAMSRPDTVCTDCGETAGYGHLEGCAAVERARAAAAVTSGADAVTKSRPSEATA